MGIKSFFIKGVLVFCIGVAGVFSFHALNGESKALKEESHGIALEVPGKENLKDLAAETETILKATVPGEYEVVEAEIEDENSLFMVEHIYKITVKKNAKSPNGTKYRKGDVLEMAVPAGVRQRLDGEVGELVPLTEDTPVFETGEYLLFLEEVEYKALNKNVMMLSNFNHVYKKQGNKYKNIGSELIPVIEEDQSLAN